MTWYSDPGQRRLWLPLAIAALTPIPGFGQCNRGHPRTQEAGAAAKLVDDLANRNRPPKLVPRPRSAWDPAPLFPRDYDWAEQDRVRRALFKVRKDLSPELWEELVRRAHDPRYSLTERLEDFAQNWTVGNICILMAYSRLVGVYRQHMPKKSGALDTAKNIDLEILDEDLAAWRRQRKGKALYQLQIEVCEEALRRLGKVKGISRDKKATARKAIAAEIAKLRRTQRPVIVGSGLGDVDTFKEEDARTLRKEILHME